MIAAPASLASSGALLPLGLLDIGPIEFLILAAAAIMLFGGDLPDVARKAGRIMGRLRTAARDLSRDLDPPNELPRLPPPGTGRREDGPDAGAEGQSEPADPDATSHGSPPHEPGDPHAPPPQPPPELGTPRGSGPRAG